jgi:hypothetical protein
MASLVGTTGAGMLGIHHCLEINHARRYRGHSIFFFSDLKRGRLFIGCRRSTLFHGILQRTPFFCPTKTPFSFFLLVGGLFLLFYLLLDLFLWTIERKSVMEVHTSRKYLMIRWKRQIPLIAVILLFPAGIACLDWGGITLGTLDFALANFFKNRFLVILIGISFYLKPLSMHVKENWHFFPLKEQANLFIGIFITKEPVLHLLQKGITGPFGPFLSFFLENPAEPFFLYDWPFFVFS